jgi:hypothetical protein
MGALALAVLIVLGAAAPVAAQAAPPSNAEGFAAGFFAGPAIDGSEPWFFTGFRVSVPAGRRISVDFESSPVHGGENQYTRIHGWYAAQLRFLKAPAEKQSRYWIAGLAVLPGDKLHPDGSIRERRHYSALVAGIGDRILLPRGFRLSTEIAAHLGSGIGVRVLAVLQWGQQRR